MHIENCVISNIGGVGAAGNPKRLAQVESLRGELSAVKQALAAMAASRTAVVIAVL